MTDQAFIWKQDEKPEGYEYPPKEFGDTLWINEHYYTIQTEGARAGTPGYFIRLSRCNLRCAGCDTDFDSYLTMSVEELLEWIRGSRTRWVVLTGGEPSLHPLRPLLRRLREAGIKVAVETNGLLKLGHEVDWITVSPKTWKIQQTWGHELKVLMAEDLDTHRLIAELGPEATEFEHYFVQPVWGDHESERRAIQFVKENPEWRLSLQSHKYLDIP
jgi:organic radical activating enzyme